MAGKRRKKAKKPIQRVRRTWSRKPVEKPHSTKKGEKGYKRRRNKRPTDLDDETEE